MGMSNAPTEEHQIFAEKERARKKCAANFAIVSALSGVFFLAKSDSGVKPHPRCAEGIGVADGFVVRRGNVEETEPCSVEQIAQLGERAQADVMERVSHAFVHRAGIAIVEAAAEEAHARAKRNDVRRGDDKHSAWAENTMRLANERERVFEMFDALDREHDIEARIRPGQFSVQVSNPEAIGKADLGFGKKFGDDVHAGNFKAELGEADDDFSVAARGVEKLRARGKMQSRDAPDHFAVDSWAGGRFPTHCGSTSSAFL